MKIGLLTYHWVANYGASLQTLSTYKAIEAMGHCPVIINWIPQDGEQYYASVCSQEQIETHRDFIARHCRLTKLCRTASDVRNVSLNEGIEYVVIGSDAVFNVMPQQASSIDHRFPNPYWGDGLESIRHGALSVSSQNAPYTTYSKSLKQVMSEALKGFSIITVRDTWTKTMVESITSGEIIPAVTPDPVFAFNSNVGGLPSKAEIVSKYGLQDRYALFSFNKSRLWPLRRMWLQNLRKRYNSKGVQCVNLTRLMSSQPLDLDKTLPDALDPIDWYCLIKYSECYIGVLMHPIIVCLHNNVPFFSFDHYGTGRLLRTDESSSKIRHILTKAGLTAYYHNLRNHVLFPSSGHIFRMLETFPHKLCEDFAKKQQQEYGATLNLIINRADSTQGHTTAVDTPRRRILYADLLSPSGHVEYNNILLRSLNRDNEVICVAQDNIIHRLSTYGMETIAYKAFESHGQSHFNGLRFRLYQLLMQRECLRIARERQCDLMVLSSFDNVSLSLMPRQDIPIVAVSHNDIDQINLVPRKLKYLQRAAKKAVIAVLNSGSDEWLDKHGIRHIRIPHGIPEPIETSSETASKQGFGLLIPINDNADTGILGDMLTQEFDNWLGRNVCRLKIRSKYITRHFNNIIAIADHMSAKEYRNEMQKADVVILPYCPNYRYRSSAMLMEAISNNKHVIATRLPVIEDAICAGDNGITAVGSEREIRTAIEQIIMSGIPPSYKGLRDMQSDAHIHDMILGSAVIPFSEQKP